MASKESRTYKGFFNTVDNSSIYQIITIFRINNHDEKNGWERQKGTYRLVVPKGSLEKIATINFGEELKKHGESKEYQTKVLETTNPFLKIEFDNLGVLNQYSVSHKIDKDSLSIINNRELFQFNIDTFKEKRDINEMIKSEIAKYAFLTATTKSLIPISFEQISYRRNKRSRKK